MIYRRFGKTNEMVSVLGFGCMRLPLLSKDDPTSIDEQLAKSMIRYAIDNGVNYIDTAYPYHGSKWGVGGASEPFVGEVLKDGYREKVKLATKLPSWFVNTKEDMDKYLNEQLERLQTDHIDFYLIHALDKKNWAKLKKLGIKSFLNRAIKDGRIKYAGFSFHDEVKLFYDIVDYYNWSFCQVQYNYIDEHFQAGIEGIKYAAKKDLGIVIMEPIKGGNLANVPEDIKTVLDSVDSDRTPAAWALKWVWNNPCVSLLLSGMSNMEQTIENVGLADQAFANSMTSKELKAIDEARKLFKEKMQVDCTGCEYCMPCPQGVAIPKLFRAYNDFYMYGKDPTFRGIEKSQMASNCVECGVCETKCPQGLSIIEDLKKVAEKFEK